MNCQFDAHLHMLIIFHGISWEVDDDSLLEKGGELQAEAGVPPAPPVTHKNSDSAAL